MTNPQPSSFSLKSIIENPKLKVGLCKLFFCEYRYTLFFKNECYNTTDGFHGKVSVSFKSTGLGI